MVITYFKDAVRINHAKQNTQPLGLPVEFNNERAVLTEILRQWAVPGRWTHGNAAVDRNGVLVAPKSKVACAFCAVGAVTRFSKNVALARKIKLELGLVAARLFKERTLVGVNDTLGFDSIRTVVASRLATIAKQQ